VEYVLEAGGCRLYSPRKGPEKATGEEVKGRGGPMARHGVGYTALR